MPEGVQSRGKPLGTGAIVRGAGPYPPEDPRARTCGGHRETKAPALKRARQPIGVLRARKTAELHHPSSVRGR